MCQPSAGTSNLCLCNMLPLACSAGARGWKHEYFGGVLDMVRRRWMNEDCERLKGSKHGEGRGQWGLGPYNTNPSQAAFAVLLTKHLACLNDFILMQCGSGHIYVWRRFLCSRAVSHQQWILTISSIWTEITKRTSSYKYMEFSHLLMYLLYCRHYAVSAYSLNAAF